MKKNKYLLLPKSAIRPNEALLFPIYNRKGTLLADKGVELTGSQIEKIHGVTEIFTIKESLKTALKENPKHELTDDLSQLVFPHKRLSKIEYTLQVVCEHPSSHTAKAKILKSISRLQKVCKKSPDAAIAKIITDSNENYAVRHAMHTAILCELAASHLSWSDEQKHSLVGAALTMNLSLGFMQDELLDQAKPLSAQQKQIIHDHPTDSEKLLQDMGIQNAEWLEFVGKHHESVDGTGYPIGLHEKNIPLGALLISLSDIYCAKVSGRNYREPIYANVATRDIFLEKDNTDKGTLVEIFVKILGLYPPGCYVRLSNQELGIVVQRGEQINSPLVRIILEDVGLSIVSDKVRQVDDQTYAIQEIVAADSLSFDINYDEIWDF